MGMACRPWGGAPAGRGREEEKEGGEKVPRVRMKSV